MCSSSMARSCLDTCEFGYEACELLRKMQYEHFTESAAFLQLPGRGAVLQSFQRLERFGQMRSDFRNTAGVLTSTGTETLLSKSSELVSTYEREHLAFV